MSRPPESDTHNDWPALDDRLVEAETRYEMLDGELIYVPPADDPHGERHAQIALLLALYVRPDYQIALDLLTRTSKTSDIAPDASVYRRERDPVTGKRHLAEVAIEIAATQALSYVARKARSLATRGVRRVFAIHIDRMRVVEWSRDLDNWMIVDPAGSIVDPVFVAPVSVRALAEAITTDELIAAAARDKVSWAARLAGIDATASAVLAVLAARGLEPTAAQRDRIRAEPALEVLERWLTAAVTCGSVEALFTPASP